MARVLVRRFVSRSYPTRTVQAPALLSAAAVIPSSVVTPGPLISPWPLVEVEMEGSDAPLTAGRKIGTCSYEHVDENGWARLVRVMSDYLTFRITKRLPITVVGPKTRWIVFFECYGKNGSRACISAKCLTNGKWVTLLDGRERNIAHCREIMAKLGTIQCKILIAMAAQDNAQIINPQSNEFP
jgi:hypothetical protein